MPFIEQFIEFLNESVGKYIRCFCSQILLCNHWWKADSTIILEVRLLLICYVCTCRVQMWICSSLRCLLVHTIRNIFYCVLATVSSTLQLAQDLHFDPCFQRSQKQMATPLCTCLNCYLFICATLNSQFMSNFLLVRCVCALLEAMEIHRKYDAWNSAN